MYTRRLNRKLELQAPVRVPDGAGGYSESWSTLGEIWAEFDAGSGRERAGIKTPLSRVPYKIVVRAAPHGAPSRPVAGQRFVDDARIFPIIAVADDDVNGRYLTCYAEEEAVT